MKTRDRKAFCAILVGLIGTGQYEFLMSVDIVLTLADHVSNSVVGFWKGYFGSSLSPVKYYKP